MQPADVARDLHDVIQARVRCKVLLAQHEPVDALEIQPLESPCLIPRSLGDLPDICFSKLLLAGAEFFRWPPELAGLAGTLEFVRGPFQLITMPFQLITMRFS